MCLVVFYMLFFFFFFNDTATTDIYTYLHTLSLHDALPIFFQHFALLPHRTVAENVEYGLKMRGLAKAERRAKALKTLENVGLDNWADRDRKSTRLNSSH